MEVHVNTSDERLRGVEVEQAVQRQRIDDHDGVLVGIKDALTDLTARLDKWEKRLLVLIAVMFAGSPGGEALINQAFSLIQ